MAELLKALPKMIKNVYFIFVVTQDRKEQYSKVQHVPDSGAISPSRTRTTLNVKQFRLVFKEECMREVASWGYRGGQDSEVEVFDAYDSD